MPPQDVLRAQEWIEAHSDWLVEQTRELLRIPSVESEPAPNAPFGNEVRRALDFMLALAEGQGMRVKDIEGYAGHAEFGEGEHMVMSLGHLDVVPVSEGWKHPPFGAKIDRGYIYARGATDDKGPTMASYVAALALKQTRADLPARVRLVFGCNEESGFKCVKRYFQTEEAPTFGIAPDSDWPCIHAEKGIANLHIEAPLPQGALTVTSVQGGSRPNVVIDKCEAVATVAPELRSFARERMGEYWDRNVKAEMDDAGTIALVAFGKAAHGAMPFAGDSAFVRVWRLLADLAPPEEAEKCQGFVMFGHPSGVGLGIHGRDDVTEDLTSNIGVVRSERGVLHATVNVRYPVKWSGEELKQRCERFLADKRPGWRLASMDDSPGLYFPLNSEPVLSVVEA